MLFVSVGLVSVSTTVCKIFQTEILGDDLLDIKLNL